MTIWAPDISQRQGSKFRAISEAIATDITDGRLSPGDRLPPQRKLAWALNVTVGTVSRAYAEAERSGLVKGEVGRGTYVLHPGIRANPAMQAVEHADEIDLSFSFPPPCDEEALFAKTLTRIAESPDHRILLDYHPHAGTRRHRAAGAAWLGRSGIEASPEDIVVTVGAQHGIIVALTALTQPGDRILTEALTYPGVKPIAAMLGLRLEGVAIDSKGLIPEAFEEACRTGTARVLYVVPSIQNPTTTVLPMARREAIADIARRYDVNIVEDDIYAYLLKAPPSPIASLAPERSFYINSLSKTLAPGLRIGFLKGPADTIERLALAIRTTCWTAPPLTAEVASRWIEDGTGMKILEGRRSEAVARLVIADRILDGHDISGAPGRIHVWLKLPEPWRANEFAAEARRRKVVVTPAETFAVGRTNPPHAVRICLGMPRTRQTLIAGLEILADLLSGPAGTDVALV